MTSPFVVILKTEQKKEVKAFDNYNGRQGAGNGDEQ